MSGSKKIQIKRRDFLKQSAAMTTVLGAGLGLGPFRTAKASELKRKRVIVIGIDGMDPILSHRLIKAGRMPTFERLRAGGGYHSLGTSTPPQSPVAWANFINGAGPGSHGIFDFIHRNPEKQCAPFYSAAETVPGEGYWDVGDYKLQLTFWPFRDRPAQTLLRRQGTPFWDYLDEAGIESRFYDLPSNYPPSQSKHGHHRCLSGMGTPDMLGTYGTYQYFSEDGPEVTKEEGGGRRSRIVFDRDTSKPGLHLIGPANAFLKTPEPITIDFTVHRDRQSRTALIEIQGKKILLNEQQWSRWTQVDFEASLPWFTPNKHIGAICRFYLQSVGPTFQLYVSPMNIDPSNPATRMSEPGEFIETISDQLGLFYTTGFQEDHKALSNGVFSDEEYIEQAHMVLEERLRLLEYAMEHYNDGLLFFYFSSTDLQGHMLWWDSQLKHPTRTAEQARKCFGHLQDVYQRMDRVVGDIVRRYGDEATIMVMSDHGFANFKRQFGLNAWLRDAGYLFPEDSQSLFQDTDWYQTRAYGLGINGLYINKAGRERDGIVQAGEEYDQLVTELTERLESLVDADGRRVIRKVHRTDREYSGEATELAPDLIVGYARDFRASWKTCLGGMNEPVLSDNTSAWSADHCADCSEVPGVLFSNRPIQKKLGPQLIDIAPSVLTEMGLSVPSSMTGRNILEPV